MSPYLSLSKLLRFVYQNSHVCMYVFEQSYEFMYLKLSFTVFTFIETLIPNFTFLAYFHEFKVEESKLIPPNH